MVGNTNMSNYWEDVFRGNNGYYGDVDNPSRLEIVKYISESDSVLDLGCGIGALKSLLPNNEYLGLDYSETAIRVARERNPGTEFQVFDARNLRELAENSADVVVMRHFLESQENWREAVEQSFRIANKKVIINMRRNFSHEPSRKVEDNNNDTWLWDIQWDEFNWLARGLSVNVSYGKVGDEEFVIIGKHLDDVIVTLDDFHDTNHNLPILLDLKERFPGFKATLFCIPSKCSIPFLRKIKSKYPWLSLAVHGWFHDTEHGTAQESNYWSSSDAKFYLELAENMGVFEKVWRAPGWNMNVQTYQELINRGYLITEHLGHDRWPEMGGRRYTTGHLMEVHGHIQAVNMNGLEELATTKCNFGPNTSFHFIEDSLLDVNKHYLLGRYQ